MDLSDIAKTLVKFGAPLLGNLLGGPLGASVVSTIANTFGADPNDTTDIFKKINADPQATEKLIELQKVELQRTQMQLNDIANARQREVELAKSGKVDDTPRLLALGFTAGFLILTLVLGILKIVYPEFNLDTLFMGLSNAEMIVLTYYFGSSNKDKKIN